MRAPRRRTAPRLVALTSCLLLTAVACQRSAGPSGSSLDRFTVVATGDIACPTPPTRDDPGRRCQYDLVADLVKSLKPARFLALGGEQYAFDTAPNYARYDHYFGSLKPITRPVPGPTDWLPDPTPYLKEFGNLTGPPHANYSYDIGSWHVIALNSTDCFSTVGCGPGSETFDWLSTDLATHPASQYPCTLAYFHDPRFLWVDWWQKGGLPKGPQPKVFPLWVQLYGAGVDVVLGANAHNYERWAPQDPEGRRDPAHGITEFVVGTGGRRLIGPGPQPQPANLIATQSASYGALKMVLRDGRMNYDWESAPLQPTFHDKGTVTCH